MLPGHLGPVPLQWREGQRLSYQKIPVIDEDAFDLRCLSGFMINIDQAGTQGFPTGLRYFEAHRKTRLESFDNRVFVHSELTFLRIAWIV